jgi:hypothetical protein
MSRHALSIVLLATSAVLVGVAVGYYVAATGDLPLSVGVLVMVALIFVAVLTAFHAGRVSTVSLAQINRPWDAFRRELDRSRRFERRFALLRMPHVESASADSDQGDPATGDGLLGTIRLVVRSIDEAWLADGSLYLLLPEASRASASHLVNRLRSILPDPAALNRIELAEFPEDGLTMGAVLAGLRPMTVLGERGAVRLVQPRPANVDVQRGERTG